MTCYCDNPLCDTEAARKVVVSVERASDEGRLLCESCYEVFVWGVQHGRLAGAITPVNEPVLVSEPINDAEYCGVTGGEEHSSDCKYLGNNAWDCGKIDNL